MPYLPYICTRVARLHTCLLLLNVYSISLFRHVIVMSVSNALANKLRHGQPLPEHPYRQGDDNYEAYERCRQLEVCTAWNTFVADPQHDPPLEDILTTLPPTVAARVHGYGLFHAPNATGRAALARDILACQNQPWLAVLAYLYVFGLIRVCTYPTRFFFFLRLKTRSLQPQGPYACCHSRIYSSTVFGGCCTKTASSRGIVEQCI